MIAANAEIVVGILGLTVGLVGWASGRIPPSVALLLALPACCLIGAALTRAAQDRLTAQELCGGGRSAREPLRRSLLAIEHQLALVGHRTASTHPVTELPTREPLFERMERDIAANAGERFLGVVRFVDFDRLAMFDPLKANLALRRFAQRLRAALPETHLLAHTDRDCFSIWFESPAEAAAAEFSALLCVAGHELGCGEDALIPTVRASSARSPGDGRDPPLLVARSTAAASLSTSEREGCASPGVPVPAPIPPPLLAQTQFDLEQALTRAIDLEQLSAVFQPVVDVLEGGVIGAEALLRWDHPLLGVVSPALFIPIVERCGLSERFGLWVLNAACREAALWRSEGLGEMKVAVNLSARQLLDPDLGEKIRRTLHRYALPPAALELELTETAAMTDAGRTRALFSSLRSTGLSIAIDDFGSGCSSLSYLKTLPFDKLKIDREFVSGVDVRRDSQAICRALVELGRGLGLTVLAEGVETAAEVESLRAMGCTLFQGFHFSRPLAGEAFRAFVADAPRRLAHGRAPGLRPASKTPRASA